MANTYWSDKKRILGMPISFTNYTLTEEKLIYSKGLLRMEENELLLYSVTDIKLTITLTDRIFGTGTITLFSTDKTNRILKIEHVRQPRDVQKLVSMISEKLRSKQRKVILEQ